MPRRTREERETRKQYDAAVAAVKAGRANGSAVIPPITRFDWDCIGEMMRKLVDAEPRDVAFQDMLPMEAMANESFLWFLGQMEYLRKLSLTTKAEDRPVIHLNELPASCESVELNGFRVRGKALPRVRHLSLTNCLVGNEAVEDLRGNKTLESLKMTGYEVMKHSEHVRKLLKVVATTKITSLKFTVFDDFDVEAAENLLWKCKNLKTLSVYVEAEGELSVEGVTHALLVLARTRMHVGVALDAIELEFKDTDDAFLVPQVKGRKLRFLINALEKTNTRFTLVNDPGIVNNLRADYPDLDQWFVGDVLRNLMLPSDGEDDD